MVAQLIPFEPKDATSMAASPAYFLAIDLVYQVKVFAFSQRAMLPICWWGEYFRILDDVRELKRKGGAEWIKFVNAYNALEKTELKEYLSNDDNETEAPPPVCVRDTDEGAGKPPVA